MKLNLHCSLLALPFEILLIERAQGGRIAAQDHRGEDAEDEIDTRERERNGEGAQKGKKHDRKACESADDVTGNAVVGLDEKAPDVGTAARIAYLIFMEAREATPFGNVFFPGIDLELAVELALGLLDREETGFGREPLFGQTAREECRHGIDQKERDHADDRAQKDVTEAEERMYFGKNEIEKRDEERSPHHRNQIEHSKPL